MAQQKTILSLFDYSGAWSEPYARAGYDVIPIDQQIEGVDIRDFCVEYITEELDLPPFVHGILSAVPCQAFACSGARWFKGKDEDGTTAAALDLVYKTLQTVEYYTVTDPEVIADGEPGLQWWAIENPVGRLNRLIPGLEEFGPWYFQPCDYGDPYTKKTGLWGEFNRFSLELFKSPIDPAEGSKMHLIPPGPDRQNIRSQTPAGFARAFFNANP